MSVYINLDRMPDRRRRMEAEIGRFKLSQYYERLGAVDGDRDHAGKNAAMIGCFRSHLKAAETARRIGGVVHILEDDAILSNRLKGFLTSSACAAALARYDLVFLDMWVYPDEASVRRFQEARRLAGSGLHLMDLRGTQIGCADSYLVSPRSVEKIIGLTSAELARGPRMALDVHFQNMVGSGRLTAAVIVPFLTCVDLETGTQSSIQAITRQEQRRYVMLRTAFFVDPDRQPSLRLPPLGGAAAAEPGR